MNKACLSAAIARAERAGNLAAKSHESMIEIARQRDATRERIEARLLLSYEIIDRLKSSRSRQGLQTT